jgi:hypothetical protein
MQHRSTALLFVVWTSAGCGAEVLDFPDGGSFADGASTTTDTTPGVASDASDPTTPTLASDASYPTTTTLGVDRGLTIASLSEPEDVALCEWLVGEFDSISPDKAHSTEAPSGYAAGPGVGCFGALWTGLTVPDCVLNLRANPCAATVGTLADCIDDYVTALPPDDCSAREDAGGSAACIAFRTASECSNTVFWWTGGPENLCAGALPIVPGEGACSCEAGICDLP